MCVCMYIIYIYLLIYHLPTTYISIQFAKNHIDDCNHMSVCIYLKFDDFIFNRLEDYNVCDPSSKNSKNQNP